MLERQTLLPVQQIITPEGAKTFLAGRGKNRTVSQNLVRAYAAAMKEGRWRSNGETIKIATTGELLDGQHRLLACLLAGVSFQALIVYGVESSSFDTIDIGRKRSAGDALGVLGCRNCKAVAAAIRWLNALENGIADAGGTYISADSVVTRWQLEPTIEEGVSKLSGIKGLSSVVPQGASGALYYLFAKRDGEQADLFFTDLARGSDLSDTDPVFVLRERLVRNRKADKSSLSMGEVITLCIRAWNTRRDKSTTKLLKGLVKNRDGKFTLPAIK